MEQSPFKIYNASAGSGKTYSLTKAYLKLILTGASPSKFRQILAITFTNKAVGEMKSRILDSLYAFGNNTSDSLFHELCNDLVLSAEQLRQRSQMALKRILHNYSFFEISTIDRFNHKLIKTFARDLRLSQSFEVELDTELLLHEAIGRMLERAGNDSDLTQVLISYSLEKIDEDKSWNITHDLVDIGKLLFQENHADHVVPLQSKSIGDFKEIQKRLSAQIKSLENEAVQKAGEVLQEITRQGFVEADFPRQTLPNHFKKIRQKEFNVKVLYANKLEAALQEGRILKASDPRDTSEVLPLLLNTYLAIKKALYQRNYFKNIYSNVVPLTVLNEIAKEIKNIELEREVIPISSLNAILSKEIRNQPVPFIYERLGEKYRHYFIDEFQDTSQQQWENLVPLIGNALESVNEKNEQGSLFIVGDVKQAIYRWRGGKAEQFLDLLNQRSQPFVVPPSVFNLDTNWRSYSEIIQFNNRFFSSVAHYLKDASHTDLYLQGCQQKTNTKKGGYVQLSFIAKDIEHKDDEHCARTLNHIKEAKNHGYAHADICVLVRKNSHGVLLANFLSQHQIPIVSSETLLLKNNTAIGLLIALLKVIENKEDSEACYSILMYLASQKEDPHLFVSQHLRQLESLLSETYGFHLDAMKAQPVLSIFEKAISQFNLAGTSAAYLTFLLDEALVVEKREGPGIHAFLKYWNQKKDTLSIAAPEHLDAVKIMTIHKSKGLEFPVVIFPFGNAIINDSRKKKRSWVKAMENEKYLGLDELLIHTKKEMLAYNEISAETYSDEMRKTELDAMNVLYVALTRSEKALYIISEDGNPIPTLEQATSYSDLFRYHLHQINAQENKDGHFSFGMLQAKEPVSDQETIGNALIPFMDRPKGDSGFAISTALSRLWDDERAEAIAMGNLIHFALSQIQTAEDLDPVLEKLVKSGHIPKVSSAFVMQKIMQVIQHPQLNRYYTNAYTILNEQEILTADGNSLRPDRIALEDTMATVLDYKTGKPAPSHKEQITQYADVLKAMGYKIRDTIIVYIDQEINPIFL